MQAFLWLTTFFTRCNITLYLQKRMDISEFEYTSNLGYNIQRHFSRRILALYFINCIHHKFTNRLLKTSEQIFQLLPLKLSYLLNLYEEGKKGQNVYF